jgi:hypothetical protein
MKHPSSTHFVDEREHTEPDTATPAISTVPDGASGHHPALKARLQTPPD